MGSIDKYFTITIRYELYRNTGKTFQQLLVANNRLCVKWSDYHDISHVWCKKVITLSFDVLWDPLPLSLLSLSLYHLSLSLSFVLHNRINACYYVNAATCSYSRQLAWLHSLTLPVAIVSWRRWRIAKCFCSLCAPAIMPNCPKCQKPVYFGKCFHVHFL